MEQSQGEGEGEGEGGVLRAIVLYLSPTARGVASCAVLVAEHRVRDTHDGKMERRARAGTAAFESVKAGAPLTRRAIDPTVVACHGFHSLSTPLLLSRDRGKGAFCAEAKWEEEKSQSCGWKGIGRIE